MMYNVKQSRVDILWKRKSQMLVPIHSLACFQTTRLWRSTRVGESVSLFISLKVALANSHLGLLSGCRHRHSTIPATSRKDFLWQITLVQLLTACYCQPPRTDSNLLSTLSNVIHTIVGPIQGIVKLVLVVVMSLLYLILVPGIGLLLVSYP